MLSALALLLWTNLPGVWFDAPPASDGAVRHDERTGRLRFHGFGAARLAQPSGPDADGGWTITANLDPVLGDTRSLGWVSLMLIPEADALGWVTSPENALGFLVRSNGAVQLFAREVEYAVAWKNSQPAPAESYKVRLRVTKSTHQGQPALRVEGRLNEATFTAVMPGALQDASSLYLAVGAHFHPGDVERSWAQAAFSSSRQ